MIFLLFSISLINSNHYSIDLGTQFIKIAQETIEGEPKIVPNDHDILYRPSAIAFKYPKQLPEKIKDADFKDLQIRFGKSAVSLLKKDPHKGVRFLPHILDRVNDTFKTSDYANTTDLLALLLMNEFKQISTISSTIVVTVPSYWTHMQREMISYAFTVSNIQINSIIDEVIGLAALYTHTKETHLQENPKHVLFIDVGATSVKVYGLYIKYYKDKFVANETARFWTETSGTYFFAKSYSESKKISQFKAEKLIQKLNSTEGMESPINEFKQVINDAITFSKLTVNKTIDEVQMIGGGSRIPFVNEIVKSILNDTAIRRDFNPIEACALGGLVYAMMAEETSPITPTYVVRIPNSDISVNCDGKITVPYCKKFGSCLHGPVTFNCDGCKDINIVSSKDGIPIGASTTTQTITLKSMPYKGDDQSYGKVTIESPDQFVSQVQWCSKGKKCINVPFDIDIDLYSGMKSSNKWISEYTKEKSNLEKQRQLIASIEEKISRLSQFLNGDESVSVEATEKISQEMKEEFEKYHKDFIDGAVTNYNATYARKADDDLSAIMKSLGMN